VPRFKACKDAKSYVSKQHNVLNAHALINITCEKKDLTVDLKKIKFDIRV
jgi:hypothetical protein